MAADNPAFQQRSVGLSRDSLRTVEIALDGNDIQQTQATNTPVWLSLIRDQCYIPNCFITTVCGATVALFLSWILLYLLLHEEVLPTGGLFKLLFLVICAYIVGWAVTLIRLPALLGMLITGVCFRTLGFFNISEPYNEIVVISREVALAVILIKAGLGLDAKALKRMSLTVLKLALCPCIVEAITAAVISYFLLDMPWLWGLLLGFLLSPVSPAVVVPTLLSLKERGYGEDKGIATLVIAASSLDDIASISLFGILMSLTFSEKGSLIEQIFHGPEEFVIGLSVGILWGLLSSIHPHKDDKNVTTKRFIMIGLGSLCTILGSKEIGYAGAGPLSCITASFVANTIWKIQDPKDQNSVSQAYSAVWLVMQPILFGLIGAEIDLNRLEMKNVSSGLVIVSGCLLFRIITCLLVTWKSILNWKEIIFVNFAWLPKATVQAALSPQALDLVRKQKNPFPEDVQRATMLLTTAILAILITAPLGSIAINLSGPRLLSKKIKTEQNETNDTRL